MLEDAAPDAPERPWLPDFGSLLRLGTRPSGSMLLHDIATAEGQQARGGGRPRGWLQAAAPAAGDPTNQGGSGPSTGPAPGATPSSTPSSSGPFGSPSPSPSSSGPGDSPANPRSSGPSSALSGLIEALKDAGRLVGDPAFAEVPVPTIFLGGLPAPIPAGRPTLNAQGLLQQLQQGVLPSDSLPEADREVWRAACGITDGISAFNICQAQPLARRKLLLTERGVAEQLARGSIQMVAVHGDLSKPRRRPRWNPLASLKRLAGRLAEGRQLSKKVQEHAAALGGQAASQTSSSSSSSAAASTSEPPTSNSSSGLELAATPQLRVAAGELGQYSLQDISPARRLLAGGTPPQLAWVPLRVALQLLRQLPESFVVLQGVSAPKGQPKLKRQAKQAQQAAESPGAKQRQGWLWGSGEQQTVFQTVTSPAGLEVHVVPGLHVRQVTPDGGSVEFIPVFLSASQAQALWRDMREVSGGAMLMYRRLERTMVQRRLEAAALAIAGGGHGPAVSSGVQEDEDEGGMDEPPEVSDFIRQLSGSLASEAGGGGAGGGMAVPSGLPRLAATFACGVVSTVAGVLNSVGDVADWLMMATPLGPRLLGVPESAIERCRLGDLLGTMQQYNREQAVLAACFGPPPPLSAQAQAAAAGVLALTQGEAAGAEKEEAAQTASTSTSTSANDDGAAASAAPAADDPAASAAAAQRRAASVLHYSRQLAAAALVLGLGAKTAAEDPGVAGASLGRLLAKSFMAQAPAVVGAIKHSRLQATPSLTGAQQPEPPSGEVQEAVQDLLAAGLPVLEHNGFAPLWKQEAAAGAGKDANSNASSGASSLAAAVARDCTGAASLGLAAFVKDGASGSFSLVASPLGPLPSGRGLLLVGDLNLGPRQRGRTARTTATFLTVGVDDGRKLL